jgi:quinol monooxygenase YgiN
MGMHRTDRLDIRDPRAGAVLVSGWTLESRAAQDAAARASLAAMEARPGLLRYSVFRGIEDLTLLHLSQWADEPARDAYMADSSRPRETVDAAVPGVRRDWREAAAPYRGIVLDDTPGATCLVAVRQPLHRPDPAVQRAWVDTVIAALASDATPQPGLRAATFFASADGATVLNLAEWVDAGAHRAALKPANIGQGASLGDSPAWRATREVPGVSPEYDVRRYELVGAVEPQSR